MTVINWLIVFIILLVIEIISVSLISIWFCVGALAAMICSVLGFDLYVQLGVFAAVSLICVILTRPLAGRLHKKDIKPTNVNAFVGRRVLVYSAINNIENIGEIKINDIIWKAKSSDGSIIEKGKLVVIDEIKGVTAYVSLVK